MKDSKDDRAEKSPSDRRTGPKERRQGDRRKNWAQHAAKREEGKFWELERLQGGRRRPNSDRRKSVVVDRRKGERRKGDRRKGDRRAQPLPKPPEVKRVVGAEVVGLRTGMDRKDPVRRPAGHPMNVPAPEAPTNLAERPGKYKPERSISAEENGGPRLDDVVFLRSTGGVIQAGRRLLRNWFGQPKPSIKKGDQPKKPIT